jgi:hypothetical protein
MFIQGIIILLGLIGLYYLYQYLFSVATITDTTLLSKKQDANVTTAITIDPSKMPSLYDGGEFSVSTWIYVQNWNYRNGYNKHILSINGATFDTIRIYLGGYHPKLNVRLHTKPTNSSTSDGENLAASNRKAVFDQLSPDAATLDSMSVCDLPEIDLQRWVHITVAVNGRTVDVYMDGKLARSCVLSDYYKVDGGGYQGKLLDYGGFGGYVQSVKMFSAAVSPDMVYKMYMAGPSVPTDFIEYLQSFFEPNPETKKTESN